MLHIFLIITFKRQVRFCQSNFFRSMSLNLPKEAIQIYVNSGGGAVRTLICHPREPIAIVRKKLANILSVPWDRIHLSYNRSVAIDLDRTLWYNCILRGSTLHSSLYVSGHHTEKILQIGDKQYFDDYSFSKMDDCTIDEIKKEICRIEGNEELFHRIKIVIPGNSKILDGDAGNCKIWSAEMRNLWKEGQIRITEIRMKDTNKWYIEDKFDKLCIGFCNEIETDSMLRIPNYLQKIVLKYCPKYNDNSLFHHEYGLN